MSANLSNAFPQAPSINSSMVYSGETCLLYSTQENKEYEQNKPIKVFMVCVDPNQKEMALGQLQNVQLMLQAHSNPTIPADLAELTTSRIISNETEEKTQSPVTNIGTNNNSQTSFNSNYKYHGISINSSLIRSGDTILNQKLETNQTQNIAEYKKNQITAESQIKPQ